MSAKINLKNMLGREKVLKGGMPAIIMAAALAVRAKLLLNWTRGVGADDRSMPGLSPGYKKRKVEGKSQGGKGSPPGKNRTGIRDLNYSGQLYRSLSTRRDSPTSAAVFFSGARNNSVASGNYGKTPGMMDLSEKFRKQIVDEVAAALVKSAKGKT